MQRLYKYAINNENNDISVISRRRLKITKVVEKYFYANSLNNIVIFKIFPKFGC